MIKVLAKDVSLERKRYLIEYYFQKCDPVDTSCPVACKFGIGIPSVDIAKSYTFEDLGITDWPWGYVHEIKDETLFRLPIKSEDTETAAIIGQVTIMIEDGTTIVYFQINDGFALNRTMLYIGAELPDSGIPCNYNFSREYENSILTDDYEISNIDDFRDSNGKFYIITYVDYCES